MSIIKRCKSIGLVCLIILTILMFNSCSVAKTPHPNTITPTLPLETSTLDASPTDVKVTQTPKPTDSVSTNTPIRALTATPTPIQTLLPPAPLSSENTQIPEFHDVLSPDNVDRIVPLAQWGKGNNQDVAYSPNGELLGLASSLGVYIYDSKSLKAITFYPTDISVTAIQFSPDRKTFAWGLSNGQIEIHQLTSGSLIQKIEGEPVSVIDLAYSSDGNQLISIQDDRGEYESGGKLFRWSLDKGTLISSYTIPNQEATDLSEDGQTFAFTTFSSIEVIDTNSQKPLSIPFEGYPYSLQLSPNGKNFLFDDGANISVRQVNHPDNSMVLSGVPEFRDIFYAYTCQIEADGPGAGSIKSAAFSPDGNLLALSTREGIVQIRRMSDGVILSSFTGWAAKMVFAPDSQTFVLLPGDGTIELRRSTDGLLLQRLTGHINGFTSAAFSPDGGLLAVGASDELVRIWHVTNGTRALDLQTQANQVAFSPNNNLLATGSNHGGVILWNLSDGTKRILNQDRLKQYDILRINSMQFSPDGNSLVAGSQACDVQVWDIPTGHAKWNVVNGLQQGDIYARNDPVKSLSTSPDNRTVVTNYDNSVLFFDLAKKVTLSPLSLNDISVYFLAFFKQGNQIAIGSWSKFQLWNLDTQNLVYSAEVPSLNLVISPDGRLIATSDQQGRIYLWRAVDGEALAELDGHRLEITQLAFSPDGKLLASTSRDGTIRLWGVR